MTDLLAHVGPMEIPAMLLVFLLGTATGVSLAWSVLRHRQR